MAIGDGLCDRQAQACAIWLRTGGVTAEELRELLLDAVRIHMRSDVPLGVFLSGGLDSSAMVALLAETGVQNLN